jgi:hypothetical protein
MPSMWKRVDIIDHALVGRRMVDWTLNRQPRPTTMQEFVTAMTGALTVRDLTKTTTFGGFIDTPLDTLKFRLPPASMIQQAESTYTNPSFDIVNYPLPQYYGVDLNKLKQAGLTAAELFYSRVGDYTTQECE